MKRGILLVLPVIILFLSQIVYASSAFGAEGSPGTDASPPVSDPASAANIENWPEKAQEFCKSAQDRALQHCQEFGSQYSPGGWWLDRIISASGTYQGKPIDVHINDWIVGKWDCPPHDLIVDENGQPIVQQAIYSEIIDYAKSLRETGADVPENEENIQIVCSFSCGAWPCPEDYDPYTNCVDTYFEDSDGGGLNDRTGETKEETVDRLINGKPTLSGGYYYGLKLYCEGEENIPWWQFWRSNKCKLKDCVTNEIPTAWDEDRSVIRVCCGCTCENLKLDVSFNSGSYIPLDHDPFEGFFEPKDIEEVKNKQRRDLGLIDDSVALTPTDGIKIIEPLTTSLNVVQTSTEEVELIPLEECKKPDATSTFVVAGDGVTPEQVEDVWEKVVAAGGSREDLDLKQRAEDSDVSITLDGGDSVTLNVNNFPVLEDAGLNEVKFIPVLSTKNDMITITFFDSKGKTLSKQVRSGEEAEFNILESDDTEINIEVGAELKEDESAASEDPTASVRFRVKGNKVLMDDGDAENVVVAENHGSYVGSNLMVQEALGSPGSGSTASVPSEYSSTGAAIQVDIGEGLKWYYVKGVESPTDTGERYGDQPVGTLTLEDIESGRSKTLIWYQDGSFPNGGSYGHVIPIGGGSDTSRVVVYDWGSSPSPDGISLGGSTSKVKYKLLTVGVEFTVETDWGTTTKFRLGGNNFINLIPEGSGVVLELSGGSTIETDEGSFKISGDSRALTIEEITEMMSPLQVELDIEVDVEFEQAEVPDMPASALITESEVGEHISDADNLILVGETGVGNSLIESCGLQTETGTTSFNPADFSGFWYGIKDENGFVSVPPCPLVNACNPQVIFIGDPTVITETPRRQPEERTVLACRQGVNICEVMSASEASGDYRISTGDCWKKQEGDVCGGRVKCIGRSCRISPYIGNEELYSSEDPQCVNTASTIGQSCCQGPNPRDGDCKETWGPPKDLELETDRDLFSWSCHWKIYGYKYCYPYSEELCTYDWNNKEMRRVLLDEGDDDFINCGSYALEWLTTPHGIAGVKG